MFKNETEILNMLITILCGYFFLAFIKEFTVYTVNQLLQSISQDFIIA